MKDKISVLKIVEDTIVDGPGMRISIYGAGCIHNCFQCHNPESWDIKNGELKDVDEILDIINKNEYANVTFTGGDPLYQVDAFVTLAKKIKQTTNKNIWCYTGYTFEEVLAREDLAAILLYIDVMVDGLYKHELHNPELIFKGSENQRLVDVAASLKLKEVVIYEYQPLLVR